MSHLSSADIPSESFEMIFVIDRSGGEAVGRVRAREKRAHVRLVKCGEKPDHAHPVLAISHQWLFRNAR
ncbi:hypothetical protein [Nitrosospira sp. Nsp2]|uniref:hypothetical protein n=1 Tax=Nitrosospira sp. Nsp2 TaxID=136548 RepID=UPI002158C5B9|nr:hypothetical protein [Nitrosospira sp. Nsp2]